MLKLNCGLKIHLLTLALCCANAPLASLASTPTESQIRAALVKSNFLSESARFIASVDPEHPDSMRISMFRQQDSTDKDAKIDALLIGKTVMDLSGPDINKVTVFFYSLSMNKYKMVSVRTTDVKAFSGGDVNKEELLKTLDLVEKKVREAPDQVTTFLRAKNTGASDVVAAIVGDELQIKTSSIDLTSDSNARIDALQLALAALPVIRKGVQKITVTYSDSSGQLAKSITFPVADLKKMSKQVETILAPVAVSSGEAESKK